MPSKLHHRRRGGKKSAYKAGKKSVAYKKRSQARKNMDTFFLRAKTLYNQIPTQGTTVSNYTYGGTQLLGGNLTTNAEFNFYRLQYDQFRVNRVRLSCTPKANVLDAVTAQQDGTYTLTGDGMIHTCLDRDGLAPSSIANISRYPSYKSFSLLKKWSRMYSVTYPKGVWLDSQNPTDPQKIGLIESLGLAGGITFYAENLPEDSGEIFNEPWAEIKMEFDVVFRGKTSGNLAFTTTPEGFVTGVSITQPTGEANKPLSVMQGVRGSISDTLVTITTVTDTSGGGVSDPIDDGGNPA